jgi:hypothetical protein
MHINTEDTKVQPMNEQERNEHLIGIVLMQQYNLSKGLNKFGNKGKIAVTKELQQMHDMEAFTPMDASTLTYTDKKNSIAALMLLAEKRNGDV